MDHGETTPSPLGPLPQADAITLHDNKETKSRLLYFPLEIVLLILQFLPLHDLFYVSHTCRDLRVIAWRHWEHVFGQLTWREVLEFSSRVVSSDPGRFVCGRCRSFHPLDVFDTPGSNRPACSMEGTLAYNRPYYSLRHSHIQFAIKLSSLGVNTKLSSLSQYYLDGLMAAVTHRTVYKWRAEPGDSSMPGPISAGPMIRRLTTLVECTFTPKLVQNSTRFLLRIIRRYILAYDHYHYHGTRLPDMPVSLCPHTQILCFRISSNPSTKVAVMSGTKYPHIRTLIPDLTKLPLTPICRDGHCRQCLTDFAIQYSINIVIIVTWQDMGRYASPESSKEWLSLMESGEELWGSAGEDVSHPAGSVRALFDLDGEG